MQKNTKTLDDYLRAPYARILTPDEESGTFTAEILEFPGCIAQGNTAAEAYKNLEVATRGWIQASLDLGHVIPEPSIIQTYSGRIALRLPKSLHRRAAQLAESDGVSLNQFLVAAIAEKVGSKAKIMAPPAANVAIASVPLSTSGIGPTHYPIVILSPGLYKEQPKQPSRVN